jgi:putative addiction module component (TIGR02574 family)
MLRVIFMGKVSLADVLELSVPERIQLAEDIWDSLAAMPQPVLLTDAQREELDRRLEDYHQHPHEGTPWETVKKRILGQE